MLFNILLLAGVAGAAYWYGSQRTSSPTRGGPIVAPIPRPLPVPLEGGAEPVDHASLWAAVPFGVSVAPSGTTREALHQIPPPMGPRLASVAQDCSVVAVGEGWWDAAGDAAVPHMTPGAPPEAVVGRVLAELLPSSCLGASGTPALLELRRELTRRLSNRNPNWGLETTWIPPRAMWGTQRRVMRRRWR